MTGLGDDGASGPAHDHVMDTTIEPAGFHGAGQARRSRPIHALAVATRRLANPLAGSRWFPLWAVLGHTGRTSGTAYRTPVVAFAVGDGFLIPLPFGDRTQWAKNLFGADGGTLRHRGREVAIAAPEIVELAAIQRDLPAWVRFAAGRLGLRQFVRVRRTA
jgi:deazaflavin-dependent oxidoreductase (nitroreductase family)